MGHRHSSAELGCPRGIFRADRRTRACDAIHQVKTTTNLVESKSARSSRSLVMSALQLAIRAYQTFLSPLMFSSCRFYPTCSRYAYEAIEIHGAPRGVWLSLKRLLRCHPFSSSGFDPVPPISRMAAGKQALSECSAPHRDSLLANDRIDIARLSSNGVRSVEITARSSTQL